MASTRMNFSPFSPSKLQKSQPFITSHQRFRDEGKWANNNSIVDANMVVLRKRIEVERVKERLKKTWYGSEEVGNIGWKYKSAGDIDTYKKRALLAETFEVAASVGRSVGLVFISGSILLYLYSLLLIHIQIIN